MVPTRLAGQTRRADDRLHTRRLFGTPETISSALSRRPAPVLEARVVTHSRTTLIPTPGVMRETGRRARCVRPRFRGGPGGVQGGRPDQGAPSLSPERAGCAVPAGPRFLGRFACAPGCTHCLPGVRRSCPLSPACCRGHPSQIEDVLRCPGRPRRQRRTEVRLPGAVPDPGPLRCLSKSAGRGLYPSAHLASGERRTALVPRPPGREMGAEAITGAPRSPSVARGASPASMAALDERRTSGAGSGHASGVTLSAPRSSHHERA